MAEAMTDRRLLDQHIADRAVMIAALKLIEYASRKDSLTDAERLEDVRGTVCLALAAVGTGKQP